MPPHLTVFVTLACLALLVGLTLLFTLPTLRLRQVARYLRQVLADPVACPDPPKSLRSVAGDLTGLRDRLRLQAEEVRQAERRRQDLIAFLAHDLKTPLTSVLGYLELLHDEPDLEPDLRRKYTDVALDKAKRLEELVGEFFDINTMDLTAVGTEEVQLSFLLEQIADEFYPLLSAHDLTCTPDVEPHLAVRGDGDRLARVFDNVLRNAVSYSTVGGQVDIEARREGEEVEIAIRNEGLEIPEQELTNIFRKFYRLDQARSTRTGGAGLGLAIAREIVERHGGSIRAETDGRRTSFVIRLPTGGKGT